MRRGAAYAGVVALVWLLGPWVLVLALLSLAHPRVRELARPERPWWVARIGVAVVLIVAALLVVIPDGWLPLPPGAGTLMTPKYVGRAAVERPIPSLSVPQHPGLAPQGRNSMHNDAWATDAYTWPGPTGDRTLVDTAWYGVEECATLAFDSHDRLIGLCGRPGGPALRIIDPQSLHPLATLELPGRVDTGNGAKPWEDLCGGAYFYLDDQDRAVVETTDRRILTFSTSSADGRPELRQVSSIDLSAKVPADDCLIALMPAWRSRDGIWFATQDGRVGLATSRRVRVLALGAPIANSFAVDSAAAYVVTVDALYRLVVGPDGAPKVDWLSPYDRGGARKPGQLSQGSGTTPTLLPGNGHGGLVAITDNADPRMHVVLLRRDTGAEVCEVGVFDSGESATENSLVAVGPASVVVENNHGYEGPQSTMLGRSAAGGLARVDLVPGDSGDASCRVRWTADVDAPTSVPKVSLATGLVYAYTKRSSLWGVSAWYLSGIDARSGRVMFSVRTGLGLLANNHYAALTLAPDASAYVATLGGLIRIHDR